jgi:nucleoside-diphosphate-sugar epimerase
MLRCEPVLVTGATGFIGGRLVEKLILEGGVECRALVRDLSRAVRISRFPIELVTGVVTDAATVQQAVEGCQVVFHCAHDWADPQGNLAAARIMAEACLRSGVFRLVYVSTMAVYSPLPNGDLNESMAAAPSGWEYADNKLAIEHELLQYARQRGLSVAIVQPACVYGPYSIPFTIVPVQELRSGRVVLPDDGSGLCNLVYIDDLVDALLLAAQGEDAAGRRLLISGPSPITWLQFYSAFERILGVQSVICLPVQEIASLIAREHSRPKQPLLRLHALRGRRSRPARALKSFARHVLGQRIWENAKRTLPQPLIIPDPFQLSFRTARAHARSDEAARILGYRPHFDFTAGMRLTEQFIRWARI